MAKLIEITGKVLSGEWGTDDESGNGIPVLRTTNFTNEGIVDYSNVVTRTIQKKNIDAKYLRKGDIIIEKSGGSNKQPVGRVIYFDGPESTYLFNNFTGLLRVKNQAVWLPRYVFYSLFHNYRKGGTRPFESKTTGLHNLKTDDYISRYEVLEAPISEQQSICKQLDYVYDIIKTRQQQLQKLDELIKARFVELFGDPLLDDGRYCKAPLGCLAQVGSSKRIFEKEYVSEGIPFYRTKEIVELSNGNKISTELFITPKRYNEIRNEYGVPQAGDLLISAVGTIGVIWIVDGKNDFYFKDGNLLRVANSDNFMPVYLKCLLETLICAHKSKMSSGTAYAALTISTLKEMSVYKVPLAEQSQFSTFVSQVDKSKAVEGLYSSLCL
mgnify:CR=1 FL=1